VYEGQHLETVPLSSNHPNLAGIDYVVELIETDDEGNPLHNIEQILNDIEQIINSTEPAYPINLKNNTVINLFILHKFIDANEVS
jgi:ubiquitin-protein ligase